MLLIGLLITAVSSGASDMALVDIIRSREGPQAESFVATKDTLCGMHQSCEVHLVSEF